jgi:hypothetical protein
VALGSLAVWVPVALFTRPSAALSSFYERARPFGFWGPLAAELPHVDTSLGRDVPLRVAAGMLAVFGTLFGLGGAVLRHPAWALLAVAGLAALTWLIRSAREDS